MSFNWVKQDNCMDMCTGRSRALYLSLEDREYASWTNLEHRGLLCLNNSWSQGSTSTGTPTGALCQSASLPLQLYICYKHIIVCVFAPRTLALNPVDYTLPPRANYVLWSSLGLLLRLVLHWSHDYDSILFSTSCWSDDKNCKLHSDSAALLFSGHHSRDLIFQAS